MGFADGDICTCCASCTPGNEADSVYAFGEQSLYEGEGVDGDGLITYHRTDGVSMSPSAVDGIRQMLQVCPMLSFVALAVGISYAFL